MDYLDFELRIGAGDGSEYPVTVIHAAAGGEPSRSLAEGQSLLDVYDDFGGSLVVGLWYGGLDAIEHGLIRLIIARRGHAPLNYALFLDYAADELNFLQKVGGSYVFIHRYLLEHFAEIAVEQGYVSPADEEEPKRV